MRFQNSELFIWGSSRSFSKNSVCNITCSTPLKRFQEQQGPIYFFVYKCTNIFYIFQHFHPVDVILDASHMSTNCMQHIFSWCPSTSKEIELGHFLSLFQAGRQGWVLSNTTLWVSSLICAVSSAVNRNKYINLQGKHFILKYFTKFWSQLKQQCWCWSCFFCAHCQLWLASLQYMWK